ncbi:uncharacterized protein LOC62_02G001999 [Vanrija pseudolonga]|uniref:Uncharacterized protein n=1 Tax=Vanrija pseudolonga TaxID=143232 RepID=A0AAF0Y6A8_9TREE|nr:hypothetical protein LOC62_02G001999 [Vanrija pseudolonga]
MVYPGYSSPIAEEYERHIAHGEALGPRSPEGTLASVPVFCAEVGKGTRVPCSPTQGHLHCSYVSGRIRSRRWVWGIPNEDTVIVLRAVITQYEDDSIEIYKHSPLSYYEEPLARQSLIAYGPNHKRRTVDAFPVEIEVPAYVGFLKDWNDERCLRSDLPLQYEVFGDDDSYDKFNDDPAAGLSSKEPHQVPDISSVDSLLRLTEEWLPNQDAFWRTHSWDQLDTASLGYEVPLVSSDTATDTEDNELIPSTPTAKSMNNEEAPKTPEPRRRKLRIRTWTPRSRRGGQAAHPTNCAGQ